MTDSADDVRPLDPVLEAIVHELAHARTLLLAAADRVPAALRDTRAVPDRWSAAEVLAHLVKVEDGSGRLFSSLARRLRESGAPADSTSDPAAVLAAFDRFPMLQRDRVLEAPDMVQPESDVDFDTARARLDETRARLLQAIHKANGLPLGTVSAPHPRLGEITLYEWLIMIARHEVRHIGQLDELHAPSGSAGAPSAG